MKLKFISFYTILCIAISSLAQTNSISINAELDSKNDLLKIQQEIVYYNNSNQNLSEIYFHNWQNGYLHKNTPLAKRMIEDYNKSLYFAKESERGRSNILNITANYKTVTFSSEKNQEDILKIELSEKLSPNDSIIINATYTVKIPDAKFTRYGKTKTGYYLRYWYLAPATYLNGWQTMSNLNIDDMFTDPANFYIKLTTDLDYHITSNLSQSYNNQKETIIKGNSQKEAILIIDNSQNFTKYKTENYTISTDVDLKDLSPKLTSDLLNREITFIESFLGKYPHKEILIDRISQKRNPIYGLNQLPNFLSPFSDIFEKDLTIFKILSKKFIDNSLFLNQRKDYWLTDGIQTFLLMEYVKEYYPEVKLLGSASNSWFLRTFNVSKLNFNDKYPFIYQFVARRFLDQALTTQLDSLSNFNRKIGNKYKAGLGIQYLKGYVGDSILKSSLQEFYQKNKLKISSSEDFNSILSSKTSKDLKWFFGDFINTNKKIDYTIKGVSETTDSLKVIIKNKRNITAPVALYGVKNKEIKFKQWVDGIDSTKTVTIAKGDFDKISLNYEQLYPEYNSQDNWKNLKKSFLNKPLQLRLIKDIQDPYYNQLFYQPNIDYNYYDGLSLGIKLHNKPIIRRNFSFKIIPTYATKSKTLTGLASANFTQFFEKSKLHSMIYGASASNYHYAPDLSYSVFAPYISGVFRRNLRDASNKFFMAKYVKVYKESAPNTISKEQDKYNVLNLKFVYNNPNIIEGFAYKFNTDIASNFTKLSADLRYRVLTDTNRQLDFRVFGGVFLNNTTTGNYFSFGLDRPSDYLFEQVLFGRSESSGIFSQQIIINDGGFKSVLPTRFANKYMFAFNSSIGLWRWIEYYNDVAFLKNKGESNYFAYENGVRFNFVHNIFEIYFPMYSNLGWEVSQEAYPSKIRFVLTLKPTAIYNFFRRGFL